MCVPEVLLRLSTWIYSCLHLTVIIVHSIGMMAIKYREGYSIIPGFGSTNVLYRRCSKLTRPYLFTSRTYALPTMEPDGPRVVAEILYGIGGCVES